jgi:anti-sigma regulatory factor (Ser/Thr protein kinase)
VEVSAAHLQVLVGADSSQTGASRACATELAASAGFDATDAHRVGLVATEMATNLLKHAPAGHGELLMRVVTTGAYAEIEILSVDRGPGMADVHRSLEDGYSTAGSSGTGLGAIRRLSDSFDVYSLPGRGTTVMARLCMNRRRAELQDPMAVGAVSLAKKGETVCGDRWQTQSRPSGVSMLVADGLGHGLHAADASMAAVGAFVASPMREPSEALERIHQALRHTRGAAAAIADVRSAERVVRFAGVGNIVGAICGTTATRQTVCHTGTLGHRAQYFRDYTYPWEQGSVLVMHSDGLSAHWSLDSYPGLRARHPALIAATLYRDLARERDDVTVLVAREAA